MRHRRSPHTIEIGPIGAVDAGALEALREPLADRFRATTVLGAPMPLRPEWFAPARRQYRADRILDALVGRRSGNSGWTLGVADQDLYAPRLRFVFGQATVDGCCAVIGLARLRPEYHRRPPDRKLFRRRVLTEAVHELGHVAGREHCADPRCVMHFSNTLEDTDLKGTEFCPHCAMD